MKLKIPPPILTFIAAFAMWVTNIWLELRFFESDLILIAVFICCLLAVFFLLFAVLGFIKFKTTVNPLKPESTKFLVTNGVYNYSRNPMYAGMALLLLAWLLWLSNPINIVIFITYIVFITQFQIKPEEDALLKLFGDQFNVYCQKVRRWI
jgi:protein-S-isoprenylcysteine O-methyltransferase Ste14